MDEIRQSPEQFLKEIKKEEQSLNRGHLKIFFGYAAGVGKTYAMLKSRTCKQRDTVLMSLPVTLNRTPVLKPLR